MTAHPENGNDAHRPVAASVRQSLYQRFEHALLAVEPSAVRFYRGLWSVLQKDVTDQLVARDDLRMLIGPNDIRVMHNNHACHVQFLASVFDLGSAACLVEIVIWVYRSYTQRGFSLRYFPVELAAWQKAIRRHVAPNAPVSGLLAFYDQMIASHDDFAGIAAQSESDSQLDPHYAALHDRFLEALLAPDERAAEGLIRERITAAAELPLWWTKVVTPALRSIGRLWSEGEISVAQEHMATAICERVMSRSFPRLPPPPRPRATVAVVVPAGELHCVGAQMVRDCLTLAGYRVLYTGADTPTDSVVELLERFPLSAMMISTTIPFHLSTVKELIREVRAYSRRDPCRIIVGGSAFDPDPDMWSRVGAEAHLRDLTDLPHAVDQLVSAG